MHRILTFFFSVACRTTDWCLRNSNEDDFDWSFDTTCTRKGFKGPCPDPVFKTKGIWI